ncbi:MAG: MFS transporter, partial [Anaerolineales bacterium]|nr:MFS transporter [Anaerolineales bacterium]
ISLLHGPTFSAMWSAGVAYADETAVPGLSTTAQGIFNGTVLGLGSALGAVIGGFLYESSGAVVAFQWAGWATLAAFILFVGVHRQSLIMELGRR